MSCELSLVGGSLNHLVTDTDAPGSGSSLALNGGCGGGRH